MQDSVNKYYKNVYDVLYPLFMRVSRVGVVNAYGEEFQSDRQRKQFSVAAE